MTEQEIFKAYCEKYGYLANCCDSEMKAYIKSTYHYKSFTLKIVIDELKQSIRECLRWKR